MGKKKEAPIKPDQKCWAWAETVDVEELTEEQLHTSYRIRETPCKIHHCRLVYMLQLLARKHSKLLNFKLLMFPLNFIITIVCNPIKCVMP